MHEKISPAIMIMKIRISAINIIINIYNYFIFKDIRYYMET